MSAPELVTVTIDGRQVQVPKGTGLVEAAAAAGVEIPVFCYEPRVGAAIGACRMCLVEIEGMPKLQTGCTTPVDDGMVVRTAGTSKQAAAGQSATMEFLLLNHPLDCPVCDKGGECALQDLSFRYGSGKTRMTFRKRSLEKPIPISPTIALDRERCVLCARCTRFSEQIAGDPFISLLERGALQQVGIAPGEPFDSYFSGNTVQICPVGALTGTAYRFRARPFDLVSSPSVCEHCASGCAQRTDHRRGVVLRRLAGDDPEVNEEWNCDKGRWAFTYARVGDRITTPLVRDDDGGLRPASWSEAIAVAAAGLTAGRTGVLVGGRVTGEDAYAYSKFARMVLRSNDIDFRSRPHSAEEAQFLAARVAGRRDVSYADLESAPVVVLAGFEPEEESPIVFLRLRKAARKRGLRVVSIAPFASRGSVKLAARVIPTAPGEEAAALDALDEALLSQPGAIVLVGERLATSAGALSAATRLAERTGARLAWIPRRAGDRGALDAGCLPDLLPGGRPIADATARQQITAAWHIDELPAEAGRDITAILAAAADGDLDALLVGGVDPADLPDPHTALAAIEATGFVVSLELRESAVTALADVVFPVAPVVEKTGSFTNWEGRVRPFEPSLTSNAFSDLRVLQTLADDLGADLGFRTAEQARDEIAALGRWNGPPAAAPEVPATRAPSLGKHEVVLAGWRMLLDDGRLQDGEPYLAGTARPPVVRLSAATAAGIGAGDGELVSVSSGRGAVSLPLVITEMPDGVAWLPLNSPGSAVHQQLAVTTGAVVQIEREATA